MTAIQTLQHAHLAALQGAAPVSDADDLTIYDTLPVSARWDQWRPLLIEGTHPSAAVEHLITAGWGSVLREVAALRGVEQDPDWHPEGDVYVHSLLAVDKAAELSERANLTGDDRAVVILASLLHDTGKATHTQRTTTDTGVVRITSLGHDDAGVALTRAFLSRIGAPADVQDRVIPLVREHMCANTSGRPNVRSVRRLLGRLAPATLDEWAMVTTADRTGRGGAPGAPDLSEWTDIARKLADVKPRLLNRTHLIDAGLTLGPIFGVILSASQQAQDDGEFSDEGGALAWLEARLADTTQDEEDARVLEQHMRERRKKPRR